LVEQLTFVADGTTGPFRRVFLQWRGKKIQERDAHVENAQLLRKGLYSCVERGRHFIPLPIRHSNFRSRGISVTIACPTGQPIKASLRDIDQKDASFSAVQRHMDRQQKLADSNKKLGNKVMTGQYKQSTKHALRVLKDRDSLLTKPEDIIENCHKTCWSITS
jgi:hypothetical protein